MKPGEQCGELPSFGGGQGCQEAALLLVQDSHGRGLGGAAGVGGVDEERPPVAGMALPRHESLVFQVVKQGHHGGPVDAEGVGQLA